MQEKHAMGNQLSNKKDNKRIIIGMLAHVDAGKTTLSEAILYTTGQIKAPGRVDHGDAFLDTGKQERERGITIFSKQAGIELEDGTQIMLVDTPGHVDFSAEMERTLNILDYAVLVISARDGVQSHTKTLWRLLDKYEIPVFVFVNKMDMSGTDRKTVLNDIKENLSSSCCCLDDTEDTAGCSEKLLEEYLADGRLTSDSISRAIAARELFPCYFGSALKLEGIDDLTKAMRDLTVMSEYKDKGNISNDHFRGRVFKISRDKQGERLTHIKVLDGKINVKDSVNGEKVNDIRIYSGKNYRKVNCAHKGMLCAACGLLTSSVDPGAEIQPVMSYEVIYPDSIDSNKMLNIFRQLEDEDPQLKVMWDDRLRTIKVRLMGKIQLQVLQKEIASRYGINIQFGRGRIAYKETINAPVECAGHFEPLRHYAEVHLRLSPLPEGSGIAVDSECSEDELDRNWQRLIMTHIMEREHTGALTNSPVTDIRITITGGRAHEKHTEGGDFRQATYRAIRQGLLKSAENGSAVILEPWYEFRLEIPGDMAGRAISDIQRMGGNPSPLQIFSKTAVIEGEAPVSEMQDYAADVSMYTGGRGRLMCSGAGYKKCHNQAETAELIGYDAKVDMDNTGDSVFCEHGAGVNVPWNRSDEMMHVKVSQQNEQENHIGGSAEHNSIYKESDSAISAGEDKGAESGKIGNKGKSAAAGSHSVSFEDDEELKAIFVGTYGTTGNNKKAGSRKNQNIGKEPVIYRGSNKAPDSLLSEYLIVDGYNMIFAWNGLKELAKDNIDAAREALIDILANYRGYRNCRLMVVFDAYRIKGGKRHLEQRNGIEIAYTGEGETADTYIERTTYDLAGKGVKDDKGKNQKYRVTVATSDRLEQMMIMGNNARRLSAADLLAEIEQTNNNIKKMIQQNSQKNKRNSVKIGHIIHKNE